MSQQPRSIQEAVEVLLAELPEKDRHVIRLMSEEQLSTLHFGLGNRIRNEFGLWRSNQELLRACCPDNSIPNADGPSMVIMKALWWKLQPVQ